MQISKETCQDLLRTKLAKGKGALQLKFNLKNKEFKKEGHTESMLHTRPEKILCRNFFCLIK